MLVENTMEYQGFLAKVEYSAKDHALIGKVLSINSIPSFTAKSVGEIESLFHRAVDDYLRTCRENGQQAGISYKGVITVRITPELHRALALQAAASDRSLNNVVAEALAEYAERHPLSERDTDVEE